MTGTIPPRRVPASKLTDYLLKSDHPVGGPKAAFFRAFGFSADVPGSLGAALAAHPDHNPVETVQRGPWGTRYIVRCSLRTPDRRDPCILTVLIVPPGQDTARLVTAYPAGS
ncbi:DUF6883 domain-containing protein [Methylobacterium sp. A54F]